MKIDAAEVIVVPQLAIETPCIAVEAVFAPVEPCAILAIFQIRAIERVMRIFGEREVIPGNIVIGNSRILFVRHSEFECFEIPPHLLKPHSTATHFLHNLLVLFFGVWLI